MGATATDGTRVRRDGDALVFTGPLDRASAAALWRHLQPLLDDAVSTLDLRAVDAVDSAGVALLAQVAAQTGVTRVSGAPAGLSDLRAAYRLDERLACATAT